MPKGLSEALNRRTDNTKAKGQTTIYKTLHRKQKIEQHEPHQQSEVNADALQE